MVCLGFKPGAAKWEGANEFTELWRHPHMYDFRFKVSKGTFRRPQNLL